MKAVPSLACVLVLLIGAASPELTAQAQTVVDPSDPRFFSQTNFRVDNDAFWN